MNISALNTIALNSNLAAGGKSTTYSVDAHLVTVGSETYSVDAILQASFSRTYGVDALLQGGSSKFYSVDAILVTPYHDQAHWGQMIGNNIVRPIDPNRVATWSTFSRPSSPIDGMTGRNVQTGKIEVYDEKSSSWKDAAGNTL
jgi:hypothetical protein